MQARLRPELQIPRLPAEWEPHAALLLTWPHAGGDWGRTLPEIEHCFEQLACAAAAFEPLLIVCPETPGAAARVRERLLSRGVNAERCVVIEAPSNDVWARDHGPITIQRPDGSVQLLDFRFNGWGERHPSSDDDRIPRVLTERGGIGSHHYRRIEWVLEGGSIDCDGAGTLLTTTRCMLNPNRNGQATRKEVESQLAARLGAHRIIWLDDGWLAGDDTDGHVDMLARFVDSETIAHVVCDDPNDPHYEPLQAMATALQAARTVNDGPYRLIELPLPEPIYDEQGQRLPASYANFVFVNGGILVPAYGDPADTVAAARLAAARPDRRIVSVPARALIRQGGSLHCATMQLPAGVRITAHAELADPPLKTSSLP
ncbi:agmatine deiminase [Halorhodospira abdelmalekii]|uniref:agmatine deiminase family protein n=1 Tax=Halorhodospira abdelmalekii TaxID=421629 RepID=UPI00190344E4|nr:agmatine deiminase family protein [Halorhodospira abdelmalekii]MBK1734595.1 agmatine deiminase [Halorhodospira abdelmalekii]